MKPVAQRFALHVCRSLYKPTSLRTLDEIRANIGKLEKETEGALGETLGGAR